MLKISVRLFAVAMLVSSLFGCQKPAENGVTAMDVEQFAHDASSCPKLPGGTYFIAGIPAEQRESITVGTDNHFNNSVILVVEGRSLKVLPTGAAECKDWGVSTEDRVCYRGGCQTGTFVIAYKGVAGGKKVEGKTAIRPLSGNSLSVSQNRSNQGPRTLEYRRM